MFTFTFTYNSNK